MIITPHVATMGFSTIPTLEHSSVQSILLALGGAIGLTGVGTTMRGHSKVFLNLVKLTRFQFNVLEGFQTSGWRDPRARCWLVCDSRQCHLG